MKKLILLITLLSQNLFAESLEKSENLAEDFNKTCYAQNDKSSCNAKAMTYFTEAINTANVALAKKLIADKATFFTPVSKEPLFGGEGYISVVNFMRQSFPDIQWEVKDMVLSDKVVAVYWLCTGTHSAGDFFGKKADNSKFSFSTMNFYYFDEEGKIINDIAGEGLAGMLMDLGILK